MPGWFLILLLLGSITVHPCRAEFWTNQAGRMIEARLEAFEGNTLVFLRTNGTRIQIPLKALAAADQRRALAQAGKTIAPDFVQAAYKDAYAILEQFDRLAPELRTEEAAKKARRLACSIFDTRLKPRLAELKEKDIQAEVQRLRAALVGEAS